MEELLSFIEEEEQRQGQVKNRAKKRKPKKKREAGREKDMEGAADEKGTATKGALNFVVHSRSVGL